MAHAGNSSDGAHVHDTLKLLNEFEAKKNYFEYNIRRLRSFQTTDDKETVTPSTIRRSNRKRNDQSLTSLSQDTGESLSPGRPPSCTNNQVIYEQLQYLFDTNLNLIETINRMQLSFESIKSDYNEIRANYTSIKDENSNLRQQLNELRVSNTENNRVRPDTLHSSSTLLRESPTTDDNTVLKNRIIQLEQQSSNNDIILQGEKIENIIGDNNTPNSSLHEAITLSLTSLIPDLNPQDIDNIQSTNIIGSTKKTIKMKLTNKSTKIKLLRSIKRRKLNGLYVSEYLVPERRRLFHATRHLSKNHPNIVKQVYSREGVVYIRTHSSDRPTIISNDYDFKTFEKSLTGNITSSVSPSHGSD